MRQTADPRLLLDWYDAHARDLPWRVGPGARARGVRPDPYRVWLSEVMLQQTTVAAVRSYFERFTTRWPTVGDLAAAPDEDVMGEWAGLGYYARARNLLKCARVVAGAHGGRFPETREGLMALPGIGRKCADIVLSFTFGRDVIAVDTHVHRVCNRIGLAQARAADKTAAQLEERSPGWALRDGHFWLIQLGKRICTARAPECGRCPVADLCLFYRATRGS